MRALKVLSFRGSPKRNSKDKKANAQAAAAVQAAGATGSAAAEEEARKQTENSSSASGGKNGNHSGGNERESSSKSSMHEVRMNDDRGGNDPDTDGEEAASEGSASRNTSSPHGVRSSGREGDDHLISSTPPPRASGDKSREQSTEGPLPDLKKDTAKSAAAAKPVARRVSTNGAIREVKKLSAKLPWASGGKEATLPPYLQSKLNPPASPIITTPSTPAGHRSVGSALNKSPIPPPVNATSSATKPEAVIETTSQEQKFAKLKATTPKIGTAGTLSSTSSTGSMQVPGTRERTRSQGKYLSTAGTFSLGTQLSEAEQAFMPGDLIKRLGASAGQLPPAPSAFAGGGAVLFVDVSGFTKLGESLLKENVPVKASQKLAEIITKVLNVLACACLDNGGEIGKFAGDALLCVWDSKEMDRAEALAKKAGYDMLVAMQHLNKIEGTSLRIHGGIAKGSLIHIHLGSQNDDLRWYLMAGEAIAAATQLVDVAQPGEFCCQDGVAKGLPTILDLELEELSAKAASPDAKKSMFAKKRAENDDNEESDGFFKSMRRAEGGSKNDGKDNKGEDEGERRKKNTKSLARGKMVISTSLVTLETKLPPAPPFTAEKGMIEALIADGLPEECNVYIPTALRGKLDARERKYPKGEMRRRIAVMFVELEHLRMSEEELVKRNVHDGKLDALNEAFVVMTRITHTFEGEVRDMLFDDKGCIFIAMFGAHPEEEREDNKWNVLAVKAAIAITNEVPKARIGVSSGHCFVGIAGVSRRRTDFVVIGHEVNMAARYMSHAVPGQIIVSSGVWGTTRDQIAYGPEFEVKVGKGDNGKSKTVYSPQAEVGKRGSFLSFYKKSLTATQFVGRINELALIEQTLTKISTGRSGVVVIEGPPGRGKSTLVSRVKKMGRGRIEVVSGSALATERSAPYFCFRQILESFTGIRPAMTQQEARSVIEKIEGDKGDRLNIAALAQILPWIGEAARPGETVAAVGGGVGPEQICDTILKIIRLRKDYEGVEATATMFVIEDVQWMDAPSLELLFKLLDGTDRIQRFAILLTFRLEKDGGDVAFAGVQDGPGIENVVNTPPPASPSVRASTSAGSASSIASAPSSPAGAKLVSEKERREMVNQIRAKLRKFKFNSAWVELQPLARNEFEDLCESIMKAKWNLLSSQKLWDVSKGDPFFVEMLCEWLQAKNGVQTEKAGTLTITVDASQFPKNTEAVISARMALLSPTTIKALGLGSSGGETFDSMYVAQISRILNSNGGPSLGVTPLSVDQVNEALHEATDFVRVGQVETGRDVGFTKWKFKHDLMYRSVWKTVDANVRSTIDKFAVEEKRKLIMRLKLGDQET